MDKKKYNPLTDSTFLTYSIAKTFGYAKEIIFALKYELDRHVYYYGNHFTNPFEKQIDENFINIRFNEILNKIKEINQVLEKIKRWPEKAHAREDKRNVVVCNAYFRWEKHLDTPKITTHPPLWLPRRNANPIESLLREQCSLTQEMFKLDFRAILHPEFINILQKVEENIKEYYNNRSIKAFIFPYTLPYFEHTTIKIFNSLNKKTFLTDHGLTGPTMYTKYDNFSYYVIWGGFEDIDFKNTHIKKDQILISGHPKYKNLPTYKVLDKKIEDILAITLAMGGAPNGERGLYQNRGVSLDYIYKIQNSLKEYGIKSAMLRPHPSESPVWYNKFINHKFYTIKNEEMEKTFSNIDTVIGPRSTFFLDSLYYGKNYICYLPENLDDVLPLNKKYPPFDGKNKKLPIAETEDDLLYFLKNKITIDPSILEDFIHFPFNPRVITDILDEL